MELTLLNVVITETIIERFWSKVQKTDTCWLWTGTSIKYGYGSFYMAHNRVLDRGIHMLAHRFSYTLENGPIDKGSELDHLCRVPACVNPAHLEAVTHQENMRRAMLHPDNIKTHCKYGHPLSGDNLRLEKTKHLERGWARICRTCKNARLLARRVAIKERLAAQEDNRAA